MPVHILNDFMREEVTLPSGVTDPWQDTTTYDSQGRKSGDTGFDSGDTAKLPVDLFTDVSGRCFKSCLDTFRFNNKLHKWKCLYW